VSGLKSCHAGESHLFVSVNICHLCRRNKRIGATSAQWHGGSCIRNTASQKGQDTTINIQHDGQSRGSRDKSVWRRAIARMVIWLQSKVYLLTRSGHSGLWVITRTSVQCAVLSWCSVNKLILLMLYHETYGIL
jgi:hypothetical protein